MAQPISSLSKLRADFVKIRELDAAEAQNGILHSIGQKLKDLPKFFELPLQEQDESIKFLFQVADSSSPDPMAVKQKAREIIFLYVIPKVFRVRNQSFSERIDLILDFLGNPEHLLFQDPFQSSLLFFLRTSYRLSQNLKTPESEIARSSQDAESFQWRVDKICQALVNARDYDYLEENIILEAIPALQKLCLGEIIPPTLPFGELSKFFEKKLNRNHLQALATLGILQGLKPVLENTSIGRIKVERMPNTHGLIGTEYTLVPAPVDEKRGFDKSARLHLPHVMRHTKFVSPSLHETIAVQCDHHTDDSLAFTFWTSRNVEIEDDRPRQNYHQYSIENHTPHITYEVIQRST